MLLGAGPCPSSSRNLFVAVSDSTKGLTAYALSTWCDRLSHPNTAHVTTDPVVFWVASWVRVPNPAT